MKEECRVRAAGLGDIDRIVELWAELVDFHLEFDPRYARHAGAEAGFAQWLRETIDDDDRLLLVVEVEGAVVGFTNGELASYPPCFAHRAHGYLDNMTVASGFRRRGLGTALLEAALAWFRAKGVPTVEGRVHLDNAAGMAFWRKTEFRPYMQMIRAQTRRPTAGGDK